MIRQSTGLVNFIASRGSYREAFQDGIIAIYAGVQPSTADASPNALLLNILTRNGATWSTSTAKKDKVVITAGSTGDSYVVVINGTSYSYTQINGDTATTIASALASLMANDKNVIAISLDGTLIVISKWPGISYVITNTGSTTPSNNVITNITANARGNGIQFLEAISGITSKESDTWSGLALANGNAGWARIKSFADNDSDDSTNNQYRRLDIAINTVNSDMIALSSVAVVLGVNQTCDTFNIIVPKQ